MRLIDADQLKKHKYHSCKNFENAVAVYFIDNAPTVDAVPVVRCKDCKYAHMTIKGEVKYCDVWFPDEAVYADGDFYCASGERKQGYQDADY